MARESVPSHTRALAATLCAKLETDWRAGRRRSLVEYTAGVPADSQSYVLAELVRCEMDLRRTSGERPDAVEYLESLTRLGPWVPDVLRELAEAETAVTLVAIEGPNAGRQFRFTSHDTFLIGRSSDAHFCLPNDDALSRMQFLVEVNPPLCRLTDLTSRNGTFVNGQRVESRDLSDGDLIRAGLTVLRVGIRVPAPHHSPQETRVLTPPLQVTLPAATPPAPVDRMPRGFVNVPGYAVTGELGRGGMGAVYSARRLADGETVAIKAILPAFAATPRAVALFRREADILRQLDHPNIVRYLEFGEANGALYCVMDYVAGTDAAKLVRAQGRLPVSLAVRLTGQLCESLAYAHGKGFVHRDVKPGNVLVAEGDRAVLADFGVARAYEASGLSGLTLVGQSGGTVSFMAPEQVTDFRNVKPAADQYGVAATLYYLLTGEPPIRVSGASATVFREVLLGARGDLSESRPDAPPGLAAVVNRALKLQPRERYSDITQFAHALAPFG